MSILRPLRDKIAMEKHRGVLECQMSRASAQVRWFKGGVELWPGPKYEMVSDGLYRKLVINEVQPEDEDTYTCDAGDVKTSAQFFVEGAAGPGSGATAVSCAWEWARALSLALILAGSQVDWGTLGQEVGDGENRECGGRVYPQEGISMGAQQSSCRTAWLPFPLPQSNPSPLCGACRT